MILQEIIGIIFFLAPGFLLSYIIFSKSDIIERLTYSIISASLLFSITFVFSHILQILDLLKIIWIFLILLLLIIVIFKKKNYKTYFNKDIYYVALFSLIGTIWKALFLLPIKHPGDAYRYAFGFLKNEVPNLGFYTGMAKDHSKYIH